MNNISEIGISDGVNSPLLDGEDLNIMHKLQVALKQLQETNNLKEEHQLQTQEQWRENQHIRIPQHILNKTSLAVGGTS